MIDKLHKQLEQKDKQIRRLTDTIVVLKKKCQILQNKIAQYEKEEDDLR